MAALISNLTTPNPTNKTQTSSPAVAQKSKSIFDILGISPSMGIGGKSLFPNSTAPSTAVQQPSTTTSAPVMTVPQKNTASGIVGQNVANQNSAISTPKTVPTNTSIATPTTQTKGLLTPPSAPTAPTYPELVSGLVKASKPSKTQTSEIENINNTAKSNEQYANEARNIAALYGPEIARVGALGAGAGAGYGSTGSNIVGEGNAAIAAANATARMQALAAGEEAQLAGNQQGLTAANQQAAAYGAALGGANTQQGQTISGYGTAASLAQPSTSSYGQTVFNPLTGTFSGGQGNLDPQTVATNLAQEVTSGRMTYDQAVASLGYAGGAGQQFLNNALQGSGYNIPQGQATVAGQAQTIGQLPALESANTAAEGIKSKIVTYLASNPQLNPSSLAAGNTLQQWIQGKQLTDPKYQTLFNYLNEYTNTLAPILGVGGDPTNLKTQIAQSFINAAASGQSIAEVLDNMQTLSTGKLQDLRSGATGGGVVSSPVTGSGTGTGSIWDF